MYHEINYNRPVHFNGPNHKGYDTLVNRYHVTRIVDEDDESITFELEHIYRPDYKLSRKMIRHQALLRWVELYQTICDLDMVVTVVNNLLKIQKPLSDPAYQSHFFYLPEIDDILVIPYGMFQFLDNPLDVNT